MGGMPFRSPEANIRLAVTWLEAPPPARPFVLLNKMQLKVSSYQLVLHFACFECLLDKQLKVLLLSALPTQAKYRELISRTIPSKVTKNSDFVDILSASREPPSLSRDDASEAITPLEAVVQTNFVPPFKGVAAELCRMGHEMEPVYGHELLQLGKDGINLGNWRVLVINHLFRAGLLHKYGPKGLSRLHYDRNA